MHANRHGLWMPLLFVLAATTGAVSPGSDLMAQSTSADSFQLSPGILVSIGQRMAYVMKPEGGLSAIDLAGGKEVWHSPDAARPLTLAGDQLVSQAEPKDSQGQLRIVTLDARVGRQIAESTVDLPPGVNALLGKSSNKMFSASARIVDGDAAVSWLYAERPVRGAPPRKPEVLPGESLPAAAARPSELQRAGEFRLNLATGTVKSQQINSSPTPTSERVPEISADNRLRDVPEPQFLSADGRYVMSSELVGDDSVWDKYRWTIYDLNTGRRLGQLRAHVGYAPFFVIDSALIHEEGPHAHRIATGVVEEEPFQIRAVDLNSGNRLWTQTVRDLTVRSAPPP